MSARARPIVAIDGPAGAGKSTVSRNVADALGFLLVDTGALYRAVALAAQRAGVPWDDGPKLGALARSIVANKELRYERGADGNVAVLLGSNDVTEAVRAPEMGLGASTVSAHPDVRDALLEMQRAAGRDGGVVLEGRDIGTVVFPDAEAKFFLTAKPEVRAQRRFDEQKAKGQAVTYDETLRDVLARDRQDETRAVAPLRRAVDAELIDCSSLSADETVALIVARVNALPLLRRAASLALALLACGASRPAPSAGVSAVSASPPVAAPAPDPQPGRTSVTIGSLLSRPPDIVLTVRPQALARDRVYGPLLRRASEMATAYAGPTTLGTTALGVLEKTDELVMAENDHGREALIVLRGVPGNLDPAQVVDTNGKPVWRAIEGDVRTRVRELAPRDPADTALFVAPGLVWVIASGPAVGQVRAALLRPENAGGLVGDETPLLALALRGETLVAQEPRLRQGALAPIGMGLLHVHLELTPGTSGLILGHLAYATPDVAIAAEVTLEEVARAFHQRLERGAQAAAKPDAGLPARHASTLDWLGAATVSEHGGTVTVRVPIPRRWLDTIAQADLTPTSFP